MAADNKDFGDVGEARQNFQRMSQGMIRLKDIMEQAEEITLQACQFIFAEVCRG